MNETKVIQVIYCNKEVRGSGKFPDPVRGIEQIIDFDGKVLMERDPCVKFTGRDMTEFAVYFRSIQPTDGQDTDVILNDWDIRHHKK